MKNKTLLFSVTMKDMEMQTFTVPGPGGGGKDTSRTGVRLIHPASGAVAEGREHRSVDRNRKDALKKIAEHPKFKAWHKLECARRMGQVIPETPEQVLARVDKMMEEGLRDGTIKVEEL
jgi:protein subunit release factor A